MEFLEYFKSRFVGDPTIESVCNLVRSTIEEKISIEDNVELCRPITTDEIETVLRSISASKALGPNRFSGYFYKYYWGIIEDDVVAAI